MAVRRNQRAVIAGLAVMVWLDAGQLIAAKITADQRIVDSKVVMALIGATTVQLGAVIYAIARAIFPAASIKSD